MRRTAFTILTSLALALALLVGPPAGPVVANGNPVTIVLSYLQGVSNFGPTNATGVAELVPREGEVRLSATGLPRLQGEEYQAWVTNTASGESFRLVTFNTNDAGVGRIDTVLPAPIPDGGWDLLVVSVEPQGSEPQRPGQRRTLAGRFPNPATSGQAKPGELPRTGETGGTQEAPAPRRETGWLPSLPLVAAGLVILVVIGAAAFGLGRMSAKRTVR